MPKPGTQTRRLLDILLAADGAWVNKWTLVRHHGFTQAGARIFELEQPTAQGGFGWPIDHSEKVDAHGFKSYRIVQKTTTLAML